MEKKNKLLISLIMSIFLSISLASAVTISSTLSQVNINQNFNLEIEGSGFYALEMVIPQTFEIVSDPSAGVHSGDSYKTITTGSLVLTLRATKAGVYIITGQYTDGTGIKNLNFKTITVLSYENTLSCPSCPTSTEWSNCEENKQIKQVYSCSIDTDYICEQFIEEKFCYLEDPSDSCSAEWICKDSAHIVYQSSDCSLSSIYECSDKCKDGVCVVSEDLIEEYEDEELDIKLDSLDVKESFFTKIKNFMNRIVDFFIFWN